MLTLEQVNQFKSLVPMAPQTYAGEVVPNITLWEKQECQFCGGVHTRVRCPRVQEAEFHENGSIKRVVYWPDGKWSDEGTIWRYAFGSVGEDVA